MNWEMILYIDDDVRAKRPLRYWKELLYEWVLMVHRVYRVSNKKASVYAEKERANTGLLAAAAIKNGWVALEECRTEKSHKQFKRSTYSGRCDLMLWRDIRYHEIEAKFSRISIVARSNVRVDKAYAKAVADSKRSTSAGYRSEKKIAITYIVPVVRPKLIKKLTDDQIAVRLKELIQAIENEKKPTLIAYAFPGPVQLVGSKNIGLGVILIGVIT
ncbi:MAG: hypothetical protein BWY27_00006 [Bacteroidetes bacterium ADurb.Bin234]|nr:MAG: hypothetical protein BWY27_00006 [Bacteroidetes bacterium ADurb.Bin234]